MKNCTLIIDGNWLLISRMSVMMKEFSKTYSNETLNDSCNKLVDFMAQSINGTVNILYEYIDNIILVSDKGSWRKYLEKPKLYQGEDYKGTRTHTDDINWEYVWKALDRLSDACVAQGITFTCAQNIEGDDWCWYWSSTLNSQGINTIIWSIDADLKQLVKFDGGWTCWYNNKHGIIVPTIEQTIDSYLELNLNESLLQSLVSNLSGRIKIQSIRPQDIVMSKIICGDSGDNILAVVRKQAGKRTLRVSEKEWVKIKEKLGIQNLQQFFENKEVIINEILTSRRFQDCTDSIQDILDVFDYNTRLVMLDESVYNQEELNRMRASEYKEFDLSYLKNNYKILSPKQLASQAELFDVEDDFFNIFN